MSEEEVKLNFITPSIEKSGWLKKQIRMEYPITDGKIILRGDIATRAERLKADYLLFYKENLPIAVVEAKNDSQLFGSGMQQAKNYAEKLGVRFAFSSNGKGFLFYDMKTGEEKPLTYIP